MSDLDLLRGLGDQILPPPIDALRETARRRTRRTTTASVVSAAAVLAVIGGVAVLASTDDDNAQPPITPPTVVDTTRPLTYAEGATIHFGDETVTVPDTVVELDLTDDGFVVRTEDGGIWFTDGVEFEQIGTLGEPDLVEDHPFGATWGFVVSGNVGSSVAWLEFSQSGQPELVVYDTQSAEQLGRHPLDIAPGSFVLLASVTEGFVYWFDNGETQDVAPIPQMRLDLTTGAQGPVTRAQYEADIPGPGTARTLMLGNVEGGGGQVIDGTAWQFSVRGERVQPMGPQPFNARDGATSKQFSFDAPAGYPNTVITWLTQWLDDDTVVLIAEQDGDDDLLECSVSSGVCAVALTIPESAVVPEIG